jgi:zinc transport system ATP-binding protein
MSENMVEIKNIHYSYEEQKVLDGIHLTVRKGEFLGIVGPNGSGKSTLVKCILRLLKPQYGEVLVFGKPVKTHVVGRKVGYVSQKANTFHSGFPATVKEVVASGLYGRLGLFRRMKKSDWDKVDHAIAQVGLMDLRDRNIGKLSGGQHQRAFIARALVAGPELLVLDEPTVGIDAKSTKQFYELLTRLHNDQGLTLIMVTHDIGVVSAYVDRIACLNKRLFFHGDPIEFERHQQEILSAAYGYEIQVVSYHH